MRTNFIETLLKLVTFSSTAKTQSEKVNLPLFEYSERRLVSFHCKTDPEIKLFKGRHCHSNYRGKILMSM